MDQREMLAGRMPPFGPVTQWALVAVSVSMAVPALMIVLSLTLKASLSRWLNIIVGALYALFVLLTLRGAWAFYLFLGSVDIALTVLIVSYAWNWPKRAAD